MGMEDGGCPIGMITNHLFCTWLKFLSLIQAMQHRAPPPHCRAHPCPTGVLGRNCPQP